LVKKFHHTWRAEERSMRMMLEKDMETVSKIMDVLLFQVYPVKKYHKAKKNIQ
jgi:hypothetical protein